MKMKRLREKEEDKKLREKQGDTEIESENEKRR